MKLSNNIIIFLFLSSFSVAYYYAYNRTNGNILKSFQFALLCLLIKMGVIVPIISCRAEDQQSTKQIVTHVYKLTYNPYISVFDQHPSGLYMRHFEESPLVRRQNPESQKLLDTITELRAGESRSYKIALLLITYWLLQQQETSSFQPRTPLPPHLESARNLIFGKQKPDNFSCQKASMFDP